MTLTEPRRGRFTYEKLPQNSYARTAMASQSQELKNTTYEAFVGILSVLSIVNLVLIYASSSDNVDSVVEIMNGILSMIFLADFTYRFVSAGSGRWQYFFRQFGWADLIASIPLPQVKILRLFRIFRAYRLAVQYGVRKIARDFWKERAQSALLVVFLFLIVLLEFGSMAMVWVEEDAQGANITTGGDAVWWAYVTVTTVGYGDQYPVTSAGRIIGTLVLSGGVMLFGTLTGFLANFFLAPGKKEPEKAGVAPGDAKAMLAAVRRRLEEQESVNARLRAQIEEIEQLI